MMSEQKIEGVPAGWRLVAMRKVKTGEWFIGTQGNVELWNGTVDKESIYVYAVVEKIEQPKRYRPFANAAEFEPHRDRWWRFKKDEENQRRRPESYNDRNYWGTSWQEILDLAVFDDGSPFGVEVTE